MRGPIECTSCARGIGAGRFCVVEGEEREAMAVLKGATANGPRKEAEGERDERRADEEEQEQDVHDGAFCKRRAFCRRRAFLKRRVSHRDVRHENAAARRSESDPLT